MPPGTSHICMEGSDQEFKIKGRDCEQKGGKVGERGEREICSRLNCKLDDGRDATSPGCLRIWRSCGRAAEVPARPASEAFSLQERL